ncbi:phospholipase A2 inhibitor and Ly6/PLAUR domain-containing protein-like [Elgaria multicarinata webbii]|uniref:phospholipase A2 inhibitor and Ly6/PLAUR domain-containing protein-like n=1 Tax=Elgaria multicarinata webbii TaxID=159646 RepID=UPI002FCD43BD
MVTGHMFSRNATTMEPGDLAIIPPPLQKGLDLPLHFTYKGCAKYNECLDGYYSLTSANTKSFQVKIECCHTDECNAQDLHLPDRNSQPLNGVQCPVCFAEDADYCDSQGKTIQCRGIENECVDYTLDFSPLGLHPMTFTAKGCANSQVCSFPTGNTTVANGLVKLMIYQLQCQGVKGSSKQPKDEM